MTNDRAVSADPPEIAVLPTSGPAPAPWTLTYDAVAVLLKSTNGRRDRGLLGAYSALLFVDYSSSAVGPYRELLSLSHLVRWPDAIGPSVQGIWVTSPESAEWGNYNWGLTKSVARIDREPVDGPSGGAATGDGASRGATGDAGGGNGGAIDGRAAEEWEAFDEAGHLGRLVHEPFGVAVPVAKPRALGRLVQTRYGNAYRTPVSARALIQPTRISSLTLDPDRVADLTRHRVIGAAAITRGTMGFHAATVSPLASE